MQNDAYQLYGMTMSPYSMKMRAYLRYRRIPFHWVADMRAETVARTKVETYMVPVLGFPNGQFKNDSTFLINELEELHEGRHVDPDDEADRFLAYLIEDFADEFLMFPFFARRWDGKERQATHSSWIIYEVLQGQTASPQYVAATGAWAERQTSLVGKICGNTDEMQALIEDGLQAFLALMEKNVADGMFLFGTRPSRADFGIYGQLSQLVIDNGSSEMMRSVAGLTTRWCFSMDDLSANEGAWKPIASDREALAASAIPGILRLSSTYHLPLLAANDEARARGEKEISIEINGAPFARRALRARDQCLPDLQRRFKGLSLEALDVLTPLLAETGCLPYVDGQGVNPPTTESVEV